MAQSPFTRGTRPHVALKVPRRSTSPRPVAATAREDGSFIVLTADAQHRYAVAAIDIRTHAVRLLYARDRRRSRAARCPATPAGHLVVGRQQLFLLDSDTRMVPLASADDAVHERYAVAVARDGRIAMNTDFGFADYTVRASQLVEHCHIRSGMRRVLELAPVEDGWLLLTLARTGEHQISTVKACTETAFPSQLPRASWTMAHFEASAVLFAPAELGVIGTVLGTLATYSNVNAASGFTQRSFSLLSYKGQTIQVYLVGTEDSTQQTSFVVDDFALNVQ